MSLIVILNFLVLSLGVPLNLLPLSVTINSPCLIRVIAGQACLMTSRNTRVVRRSRDEWNFDAILFLCSEVLTRNLGRLLFRNRVFHLNDKK